MSQQSRLDSAKQTDGQEWYRSPLVLIAGFILFLGALALAVIAFTGGGDETATTVTSTDTAAGADVPTIGFGGPNIAEVAPVTLDGDALPTITPDDDAAVGTLAPTITASSLATGEPITLGPGRARVIGFFAHWCGHCQNELPEVTQWLADNQLPPNTEFIAVSTAVDEGNGNYPPSKWFNEVGFGAPVIVDDANGTLLKGMGFTGFPAFVAVDASGVVVDRASGNIGVEGLESLFANFAS